MSRERSSPGLECGENGVARFRRLAYRTMLRNDAYWFNRLGLYIERADNTARILDVKYHVLLPETEPVGGSLDYFQWTSILRAVSALTAYHWVYRESLKPWLVADLLILATGDAALAGLLLREHRRASSTRSAAPMAGRAPSQRHARTILCRLENTTIEDLFQTGLHEFITEFIEDNNKLGAAARRAVSAELKRRWRTRPTMRIHIRHEIVHAYDPPVRFLNADAAPHAAQP